MIEVVVRDAAAAAVDVRVLTLADPTGAPLPPFSPGSHVLVHAGGVRNAYSLCSSPSALGSYRIAVRLIADGRGGSRALHEDVAPGDRLTIEAPQNLFAPNALARHHVLVAGGIGVTPFLAYVHALAREGRSFELHYAYRAKDAAPLLDELRTVCGRRLHEHLDPSGERLLARLRDVLGCQPLGTHLSVCGPAPMMSAVTTLAGALGWPEGRVHLERFAPEDGPREPFGVVLARRGAAMSVGAGETLLDVLDREGLGVPSRCRQGVCGECRLPVLAGEVDHRDDVLTPAERRAGDVLLPCVSRCARGPLVLDL